MNSLSRPPLFPYGNSSSGLFKQSINISSQLIVDCLRIWHNIFALESLAVLGVTLPCYIATRHYDEKIQSKFYEPHHNIHQLPGWCHKAAQCSVAIPFMGLSSLTFIASNKKRALTGYLTAIGWPMMQSGKDIIKSLDYKICLRPWNEHFSSSTRACGGFPSGHIASISYMTTLWALQEGITWALPLGGLGVFIALDFLTSNRHYLSQLVAGAGLGVIFGYAAHKVVEQKLNEHWYLRPYIGKEVGVCITYVT